MTSVLRIALILFVFLLFSELLFSEINSGPIHHARQASCMSNMKQLSLALSQYTLADGGDLPIAAVSGRRGWREAIYPYVQSPGVYRCPDDRRDPQNSLTNLPRSYAANALCFGSGHKSNVLLSLSPSSILVTDTRGFDGEDWNITSAAFLPSTGCELYTHKPSHYFYQHLSGTLNLLFADGHVKAMKPDATLNPINLWTRDNTPFVGQDLTNAQMILMHAENE